MNKADKYLYKRKKRLEKLFKKMSKRKIDKNNKCDCLICDKVSAEEADKDTLEIIRNW